MRRTNMSKKRIFFSVSPVAIAALFATSLMTSSVAKANAPEPIYGNYYNSDFATRDEVLEASRNHNEKIMDEGITLLKNEDDVLPLAEGSKISVFGKNSDSIISGGSGSGSGGGGGTISLNSALQSAGFSINPTLTDFYFNDSLSGPGRATAPSNGNVTPGYTTGETPISSYTSDIEASYENYSDAAIVVISRISGEGFDLPRTMFYNGNSYATWDTTMEDGELVPGARAKDDHYLQLDKNESDLIKYCGEHFEKVIVLFNTGSQFEAGFLNDSNHYGYSPNVKAALWIGYPGSNGMTSLASILKGEVNPSGHTVDTWARDFKADPVFQNFANNMQEVSPALKGNQYENLAASGGNGGGGYRSNYVTYKEGIYMGYRYYETRGFDEGDAAWDGEVNGSSRTKWDNWYDAHVVYPFGHGLSYTTFTQEIISSTPSGNLEKDSEIKVTVKVTNTGDMAGKDAVELYYTAPYTSGGIEKSHVVLGAFAKTPMIQPQESTEVTLTLKAQDMASYDWNDDNANGFKGYELDEGDYVIRIMADAHNEYDSFTLNVAENIQYSTDSVTGNEVKNRFDEVSNYIPEYEYDDGSHGQYMSRSDWEGTFPTRDYKLTASEAVINELKEWDNRPADADEGMPYYTDVMPTTGKDSGIMLNELIGVDPDDEIWETFMDQLTVDDYYSLVNDGSYASGQAITKYGITRAPNADGPAGYIYGAPSGTYTSWCSETILSSTWNVELAEEKGRLMGDLALWGNGSPQSRICGWYAPACNIHRSPFSGRNFEYYSEDGFISGQFAAYNVIGAQSKGLTPFVKHFGVNDQESNRCGLMTWANEQSMREIYLKPFELAVKVGKTRGMMSSLNRIGATWAGGDYRLMTEILRQEWGFKGCVVTDSYMGDSSGLSNANQMIRAGANLSLGISSTKYNEGTPTTVSCLREAAKGVLYANANSNAMNKGDYPTKPSGFSSFQGTTLKNGVVNAAYTASVATANLNSEVYPDASNADITYSLSEGSTLPSGLFLSADGTISGTPSEEVNNHLFKIKATYEDSSAEASFTISIINDSGSIVYETEPKLPDAIIGEDYHGSVKGAKIIKSDETEDTTTSITYTLANGSLLPDGLTLSRDGEITGKPTKECTSYQFTVMANALGYKSQSITFELTINFGIEFESKELAIGKLGIAYTDRVSPAVSSVDVTYSLKTGSTLPKGLTLTKQGFITGTPQETVTDHEFIVVASGSQARSAEATYKISIGLRYVSTDLPYGKEGESYQAQVDTAQGAGEVTYKLKEGSELPEGLTLSNDGKITGTPTECGTFTFTVVASSEGKVADEMTFELFIDNKDYVDTPTAPKAEGLTPVAITFIVIGSVIGVGLIAWLVYFLMKRLKASK